MYLKIENEFQNESLGQHKKSFLSNYKYQYYKRLWSEHSQVLKKKKYMFK